MVHKLEGWEGWLERNTKALSQPEAYQAHSAKGQGLIGRRRGSPLCHQHMD